MKKYERKKKRENKSKEKKQKSRQQNIFLVFQKNIKFF
jgi:hypothetical protein